VASLIVGRSAGLEPCSVQCWAEATCYAVLTLTLSGYGLYTTILVRGRAAASTKKKFKIQKDMSPKGPTGEKGVYPKLINDHNQNPQRAKSHTRGHTRQREARRHIPDHHHMYPGSSTGQGDRVANSV